MTVDELIEKLKTFKGDMPVVFPTEMNPYLFNVCKVESMKAFYHSEAGYEGYDRSGHMKEVTVVEIS